MPIFFDALEQKQQQVVLSAIRLFAVLAVAASAISVFQPIARVKLEVFWRQWLTERLTERWLGDQRFYRLSIAAPDLDAPEFRIAEDAAVGRRAGRGFRDRHHERRPRRAGLLRRALVGGRQRGPVRSPIPGFMVFAAAAYSVVMSGSMVLFGRPLICPIEEKNAAEARLRTEMGRVRENAESIALIGGEKDETGACADAARWSRPGCANSTPDVRGSPG